MLAVKPEQSTWTAKPTTPSPTDAARALGWQSPDRPGGWRRITRRFRDGHTEGWWAADARLPQAGWGPRRALRLVVVTTDPARLPARSTWYLLTNLPHSGDRYGYPASLAEVVRCYGLRGWVEQGYKQVKHELGWADFQVRSDRAIRRHWTLVCCAFSFCWQAARTRNASPPAASAARGALGSSLCAVDSRRSVADRAAAGQELADPLASCGAPGGPGRPRRRPGRCG